MWLYLNLWGENIPLVCLKEKRKNMVINQNYWHIDKVDKGNYNKLLKCQPNCLKTVTLYNLHELCQIQIRLQDRKLSVSIFILLFFISVILSDFPEVVHLKRIKFWSYFCLITTYWKAGRGLEIILQILNFERWNYLVSHLLISSINKIIDTIRTRKNINRIRTLLVKKNKT